MKKTILLSCLTLCFSVHAGDNNTRIWNNINALHDKTAKLKEVDETQQILIEELQHKVGSGTTLKKIGEQYHGGIIFWVDDTGQHGLIASITDLNEGQGVSWRNGDSGSKVTNARGDGLYSGESNTRLIISEQTIDHQKGQFAALMASEYHALNDGSACEIDSSSVKACYGNWYLPSIFELKLLQKNLPKAGVNNFAPDFYWSSTEASVKNAWLINFGSGEKISSDKASTQGHIRAISQF